MGEQERTPGGRDEPLSRSVEALSVEHKHSTIQRLPDVSSPASDDTHLPKPPNARHVFHANNRRDHQTQHAKTENQKWQTETRHQTPSDADHQPRLPISQVPACSLPWAKHHAHTSLPTHPTRRRTRITRLSAMMHMADAQTATPPHPIVDELPHLPSPSRTAYTFGASFGWGSFFLVREKTKGKSEKQKSGGEKRTESPSRQSPFDPCGSARPENRLSSFSQARNAQRPSR